LVYKSFIKEHVKRFLFSLDKKAETRREIPSYLISKKRRKIEKVLYSKGKLFKTKAKKKDLLAV